MSEQSSSAADVVCSVLRFTASYAQAQMDLEQMYLLMFDAPALEVPGDGQNGARNQQFAGCVPALVAKALLIVYKIHMFAKLRRADNLFTYGAKLTAKSLDRSKFDMFGSVLLIDYMERRDIAKSQVNDTEGMRYMDDAVRSSTSCAILPLTTVNPDTSHFVGKVLLDNVITDTS